MKLPDLNSSRKIRDAAIVMQFMNGVHPPKIALQHKVNVSTVYRIVYKHRDKIASDKQHEKNLRVAHLRRLVNSHPDTMAKKSTLDILEQTRKELEGDKQNLAVTVVTMPQIVINGKAMEYRIGNNTAEDSGHPREAITDARIVG